VLVLTWIVVTTFATAMAWWSVTFVTVAVADRRPLRPSDVVAASVRQAVPLPAQRYAAERLGRIGHPHERIVSPVTAVVVEAVATLPIHGATPPAVKAIVVAAAPLPARPAVARAAVTVQVASLHPVTVKPSVPMQPVPAARTTMVADLPVAAAGTVIARRAQTVTTVPVMPSGTHWRGRSWTTAASVTQSHPAVSSTPSAAKAPSAKMAPAKADPEDGTAVGGATVPPGQVRHSTYRHRPAPPA